MAARRVAVSQCLKPRPPRFTRIALSLFRPGATTSALSSVFRRYSRSLFTLFVFGLSPPSLSLSSASPSSSSSPSSYVIHRLDSGKIYTRDSLSLLARFLAGAPAGALSSRQRRKRKDERKRREKAYFSSKIRVYVYLAKCVFCIWKWNQSLDGTCATRTIILC